jgi:hypothetical protein
MFINEGIQPPAVWVYVKDSPAIGECSKRILIPHQTREECLCAGERRQYLVFPVCRFPFFLPTVMAPSGFLFERIRLDLFNGLALMRPATVRNANRMGIAIGRATRKLTEFCSDVKANGRVAAIQTELVSRSIDPRRQGFRNPGQHRLGVLN